jgi:hypothetical protein
LPVIIGSIFVSGIVWLGVSLLNTNLMSSTAVATGIELVFLPAGFRLLIILLFGFWGALGIFVTQPIFFLSIFGSASVTEIIINASIAAFVPYLVVRACSKSFGISSSLLGLRPIHLPILALAVSLTTPAFFNFQFLHAGREPPESFFSNFTAMAFGDFVGCLLVIGFVRLLIAAYRMAIKP